MSYNILFSKDDLYKVLQNNLNNASNYVNAIKEEKFLNSNDQQIIDHVISKFEILPLEIYEGKKVMTPRETKIDKSHDYRYSLGDGGPCLVDGMEFTVAIPFSGDRDLWLYTPSTWTTNRPRGILRSDCIEITISKTHDSLDDKVIKQDIENTLSNIRNYLNYVRGDVNKHHMELRTRIQVLVEKRRERLEKYSSVTKALDIPLKQKEGAPNLEILPIKRRIIKPLPAANNVPPEPGIRNEDYEHILKVIRHEGCTYETTPQTFEELDEEDIRNIIMAHLNGHLEGQATGETFRGKGKTDIRIEDNNRCAFVAECKIWHGKSELHEAINQFLGYLTWRDCKGALIIFNKKNSGFTEIQSKVPKAIEQHTQFRNKLNIKEHGEWRFQLSSLQDSERIINTHVFLFNLYVNSR